MLLKNLIKNSPSKLRNLNIRGLASNSKNVKKGFIFFAIKGNRENGEDYIYEAIKKGAILIICSKKFVNKNIKVNLIKTKNVNNILAHASSKFYSSKPKNIIAVTGTNGKTSVADFFYQILEKNNFSVASIGTLGIKTKKRIVKTNLTSPDIITLHKNLEILKKNKIDNVIIEASSHGLNQSRLNNLNFKAGIFTNFSQDHLDYHKTMKAYLNAKLILFSKLLTKNSNIITDSKIKIYSELKKISKQRKLKIFDINTHDKKNIKLPKNLIGFFQIKNLSMAIIAARLCGLNVNEINKAIKKINVVEGRLNLIKKFQNNIKVFIDYAHTPEALNTVLKSLKKTYNSKITLVFGCGGDRDFKKRPLMAKVAKSLCEKIYVTDDNPRYENPKKIRKQIISKLKGSNYFNFGDRSQAIKNAILNAEPNEVILVAGKGHESTQDYGYKRINISDKRIIKNLNLNKSIFNKKKQNYLFNSKILNKIIKIKKFYKFNGIAIDTRKLKKDNLFLAIKGKNNDGNKFILKAIKKGATIVISSKKLKKYKKYKNKIIQFNDSIFFLNNFARLKRQHCNAKILAITGSTGKTTLKNMLYSLLSKYENTFASSKSYNNRYGVPLSLSNLNLDHQYGIFEVGMSKAGEIEKLSNIIKPNLAIITNIGEAHIENFSNTKGIAKAKSEIINNVQNNGTIILNRDDKFFHFLKKKAQLKKIRIITFGKSRKADVKLIKTKMLNEIKQLTVQFKDKIVELKIKNINTYNVLASLAVLKALNLDVKQSINIFRNLEPSEGRGKIHNIKRYNKNFKLIDESYNASPSSVKNAINNFSVIKKNKFKKYLLLGDMLELGKNSELYHEELSRLINSSDIDKVFVVGEKTIFTYKKLNKFKCGNIFQCKQDIDSFLKNIITNNDYLMIKGSNATGLNAISKSMIKGN